MIILIHTKYSNRLFIWGKKKKTRLTKVSNNEIESKLEYGVLEM